MAEDAMSAMPLNEGFALNEALSLFPVPIQPSLPPLCPHIPKGDRMAKILIVDDDPDVVEAASLFLEKAGHQISSAFNRAEGLKAVQTANPDLLILDVMMEQPDDGIAMAQQLRKQGFSKPILMLTSVGKATGLSFGRDDEMVPVDAFEEKPIAPDKLVARVAELLKK